MLERTFQMSVMKEIKTMFPGCVVLKNDANYCQGIPDWIILYNDRWAVLEMKGSKTAKYRPNQEYYIDRLGAMSFASFIYPENKEEVLRDLQHAFNAGRPTRVSRRK